jgi:ABC-type nitrate/sulfonate/bicarbonate transport system permease component
LASIAHYGANFSGFIFPLFSRVARALAVSILKSNQSTLAACWRCVAGVLMALSIGL